MDSKSEQTDAGVDVIKEPRLQEKIFTLDQYHFASLIQADAGVWKSRWKSKFGTISYDAASIFINVALSFLFLENHYIQTRLYEH